MTFLDRFALALGEIREEWGELTEDDLTEIEGRRDQMIGKVQERYGMAREEAEKAVDSWAERH